MLEKNIFMFVPKTIFHLEERVTTLEKHIRKILTTSEVLLINAEEDIKGSQRKSSIKLRHFKLEFLSAIKNVLFFNTI